MSDDNIISMLTAATMKPADTAGFPDTETIFQRRRGLSKLPVHAIDGEFLTPQIARFHIAGEVIDIPTAFGVAHFFEGLGGVVAKSEDEAFFAALSTLISETVDSVYVIRGPEGNPWMIFWNSLDDANLAEEITTLFYPASTWAEAA